MQNYPIRRRATAERIPTHRAGHSINHHPEDEPYITDQRKRSSNNPLDLADGLDYPGELTRMPTSAVRYIDTRGDQVIQRGNRRFVIHDEPPPRHRRRPHWLVISGLSMIVMLLLWWLLSLAPGWWTEHQLDATYEFPRVSQADAVVYPGDSAAHPSHYLFLNLNGTVLIIELPHGDSAKARIYKGPTLFSDNADQIPVTGEFRVVNSKLELLVHIQDRVILYLNNGTQFIPQ
jgi:hypothetical protein